MAEDVAELPDMIEPLHEAALITVAVVPGARSNNGGVVALQHLSPLTPRSSQQNWPLGHAKISSH